MDLQKILADHKKWLNNEMDGVRADLSGADLSYADLSGANLSYANLSDAPAPADRATRREMGPMKPICEDDGMTDAPERIWAWSFNDWANWGGYARSENRHPLDDKERKTGAEYVRADTAAARLAEVERDLQACLRRGVIVQPDRETFDAMCAMRDAINEYIPMPSLESDLLQGPENSVFCATVAESVISEVVRLRAALAALAAVEARHE